MDILKIVGKYLFIYFDIYILQTLDYTEILEYL